MNYKDFIKKLDINTLGGVFLLHGREEFFKESCLRSCESLVAEEARVFDLKVLHEPDRDTVAEACEMLPLLSPKTVVIVKGLAQGCDSAELVDYLGRLPETTLLIISVKGELEARSKLLSFVSNEGGEVLIAEPDPGEAASWCAVTAARRGAVLDKSAAQTLVGLVGTDMVNLNNELQKLIDRVGEGGVITADIISASTVSNIEFKVFDAINCLTASRPADGLRALHNLMLEKDDRPKIIGALLSNFRKMLEGRRLMDTGLSPKAAAAKMPGSSYPNEKACIASKKYSAERLAKLVAALSVAIYDQRSGGADAATAVETALAAFDW